MKKFNWLMILVVIFALVLTGCSSSSSHDDDSIVSTKSTLEVTVKDASTTNTYLDDIDVVVTDSKDDHIATTKDGGKAKFTGLAAGPCKVTVSGTASNGNEYLKKEVSSELKDGDNNSEEINLIPKVVSTTIEADTTEIGNGLLNLQLEELDADTKAILTDKTVSIESSDDSVEDFITLTKDNGIVKEIVGRSYSFNIEEEADSKVQSLVAIAANEETTEFSNYITIEVDLNNLVDNIDDINSDEYSLAFAVPKGVGGEAKEVEIEDAKITGKVPLKVSGSVISKIILSIVKMDTSKETSVNDAKEFVTNLKQHGINLTKVNNEQAKKAEADFKDNVVPYTEAVNYRMERVAEVMDAWENLSSLKYYTLYSDYYNCIPTGYKPGNYKLDLTKLEKFQNKRWDVPDNYFSDYDDYYTTYKEKYSEEYSNYQDYYFSEVNSEYDSWIEYVGKSTGFIVAKSNIADNLQELEKWEWKLSFVNSDEEVNIVMDNLQDVSSYEVVGHKYYDDDKKGHVNEYHQKEIIDYTKGEFKYSHKSADDSKVDWSFNFTINAEDTKEITGTFVEEYPSYDPNDGELHTYRNVIDYIYTLPTKATYQLVGTMTDDIKYYDDEDDKELPAIGTISLDIAMSLDYDAKQLSYQGSFSSQEFNYNGKTIIELSATPAYDDIVASEGHTNPMISKITADGTFSTNALKLAGKTIADFAVVEQKDGDKIPLPEKIEFSGTYQDISDDNGFTLTGSLGITINYDDFNFNSDESVNNWLPVSVALDGDLINTGYEDVNLNLTVIRDGYQHLTSQFTYKFGGNKYIEGNIKGSTAGDKKISLEAYNEQNLQIVINYSDNTANDDYIGTVKDYYGTTLYGKIILSDGQPQVNFSDGDMISLLLEKGDLN